jgi:nicotinamide-nucleotide amidase
MGLVRTAEILAIGSELLSPHRLDTNSLYLTSRLNDLGIAVRAKHVVGDDLEALTVHVRGAIDRADLVVTTGGLGPTADDLTREAVAAVLALDLHEDARVLKVIERRFARRGLRMPEVNRRQAQVPAGARVLSNSRGTAPGLWLEAGDSVIVLLPGPPRELQPMFEGDVWPPLSARTGGHVLRRRVLKITGQPESAVEEVAHPIYAPWQRAAMPIETTILAAPGQIEIHLSASGSEPSVIDVELERAASALAAALGPGVFSVDGRSIEQVVGDGLLARGWRVAVAESCTGGLIGGRLTDVPGSSAWFVGGVVAYANDVKVGTLGVPEALIARHGAVSEPVARAMAEGARRRLDADVAVSVTGIAGPGGGTDTRPVGTVVIAVATATGTGARTFSFPGDRAFIRAQAVMAALDSVRTELRTKELRTRN